MKRIGFFLVLLMLGALLASPLPAMYAAAETEAEPEETEEVVEITDEEVPMAAIPLSSLDQSGGLNSRDYTIAGTAIMAVAVVGLAVTVYRRAKEKKSEEADT